jgi:hypothetical protein
LSKGRKIVVTLLLPSYRLFTCKLRTDFMWSGE